MKNTLARVVTRNGLALYGSADMLVGDFEILASGELFVIPSLPGRAWCPIEGGVAVPVVSPRLGKRYLRHNSDTSLSYEVL